MRRSVRPAAAALLGVVVACGDGAGPRASRSFLMGFSAFPPRQDTAIVVPAINYWAQRADAAIIHASPPWAALVGGVSPATAVDTVQVPLANYFRAKGLALVFAVADKLRPDYLDLVAETNLIRAAAPDSVYQALVVMANAVVAQIHAAALPSRLYVSVQVETAWGRLTPGGPYQGIAQDLADFPFVDAIGLSSYPYLGGFALEGGWPSITVGSVVSTPALQARDIARQVQLLGQANARGLFQLTFYDLDLSGVTLPPGSILPRSRTWAWRTAR